MSVHTLLIDGHVHIYPNFKISAVLNGGIKRLSAYNLNDPRINILLLTERFDCNFFRQLTEDKNKKIDGFKIVNNDSNSAIELENDKGQTLYIFAGRQIVTKEGLEINALATALNITDRQFTADQVIQQITDDGGIPVINWAPGKWFSSRGKIVERLIKESSNKTFLIGDTSMRPTIWSTPRLMTLAKNRGFKIIAGSDPLPFDGEEEMVGTFGFMMQGEFDRNQPTESLHRLLLNPKTECRIIGRRTSPVKFFRRQVKIMREKKQRS